MDLLLSLQVFLISYHELLKAHKKSPSYICTVILPTVSVHSILNGKILLFVNEVKFLVICKTCKKYYL